jgi:glycosyltransferase involved in cell wall biosynthesis
MLLWGIGVSASYDNHFDQNKKWDFARYFFGRFADALIFYSDYPISKYLSRGFKQERLFVAHNTTAVSQDICLTAEKNSFLFVGTLYAEKGLAALLRAYQQAAMSEPDMPVLYIIGDGPEKGNIEKLIRELGLAGKVFLKGAIYDMEALKPYYETALACVSPNQAGLSVLTSMGHGVPFVTEKNAITGGEIFNLRHMATGFIYEGGAGALAKTLSWIVNNKLATNDIGRNARDFYVNNRTPEHMAAALADAIESAVRQNQA